MAPGRSTTVGRPRPAFTLIEVLVVVAIIALLVSILMPALKRAREQSRASVCLAHLQQQGVGFSAYSADHRGLLPVVGSFRFSLMEGEYYFIAERMDDWSRCNSGLLYPRYVGKNPDLFYCPNNRRFDIDGVNGKKRFLQIYSRPKGTASGFNSHTFPDSPFGAYGYAVPAQPGVSPRDAGRHMYPESVIRPQAPGSTWPYWNYLNDPGEPDPAFLGPFPQRSRGKHSVHALLSDGYFGGYEGYHYDGYNVLYGDFHAKRVRDPGGRIHAARLNPVRPWSETGIKSDTARVFLVWDFFSRNH